MKVLKRDKVCRACPMTSAWGQATGHSGKPFSPINCVSQENWSLGEVAPFSVEANGFLSEVSRVSENISFQRHVFSFFLQSQELILTRGPLCCYSIGGHPFPDKAHSVSDCVPVQHLGVELCTVEMPL